MSRFDYVAYDETATAEQAAVKAKCTAIEVFIESLGTGRSQALALTALEECYMWVGKAIRDRQILRNGTAPLQEGRTKS